MSDRVPNMKRHNWPALIGPDSNPACKDCGASMAEGLGCPCPGKPDPAPMQAPRIEIAVGDSVAWTTAGAGKVSQIFDAIDNRRIASVHVAGWFITTDGYLTRADTGMPAVLEIVAADLTRKGG